MINDVIDPSEFSVLRVFTLEQLWLIQELNVSSLWCRWWDDLAPMYPLRWHCGLHYV